MYFSGRVITVVYENPEQAFYVLRMLLDREDGTIEFVHHSEQQTVVRGYVPGMNPQVGTWLGFEADWTEHPEYGWQLSITKAPVFKGGWNAETAFRMLVSSGGGERLLTQIRESLGDDETFMQSLGNQAALEAIPGITSFTALFIVKLY